MGTDPAFLFYPGDYLRDTQCLSELAQVAYDRIMCEHIRNIPISKQKVDFFTKKLSPDEKEQLIQVLEPMEGGFKISWVADSRTKRLNFSESRRKNRAKKYPLEEKRSDIEVKTYLNDMENENENENEIVIKEKGGTGEKTTTMLSDFEHEFPLMDSQAAARAKVLIAKNLTQAVLFHLFTEAYKKMNQEVTEQKHGASFGRLGKLAVLAVADTQERAEAGTMAQTPANYLKPTNGEYGWRKDIHRGKVNSTDPKNQKVKTGNQL